MMDIPTFHVTALDKINIITPVNFGFILDSFQQHGTMEHVLYMTWHSPSFQLMPLHQ